jgi:NTE family protein
VPEGARRGILVELATSFEGAPGTLRAWREAHPEVRTHGGADLALVPTVFDRLDEGLCRALVHRGWWLVGAALAAYEPGRLPDPGSIEAPPR